MTSQHMCGKENSGIIRLPWVSFRLIKHLHCRDVLYNDTNKKHCKAQKHLTNMAYKTGASIR